MNRILVVLLFAVFSEQLAAQDNSSYMMVMVKQKKALNMARSEADFQDLANTFERISSAETDQWHPLYYAGLCYINMSFLNGNDQTRDGYLDHAQDFVDRALLIYPDESEIFALQALLYQARIQVDPDERKTGYGKKAEKALMTAKDYDPDNPRVYYLLALNQVHTGERTSEDVSAACKNFKIANEKFVTFRPAHVLSPTWGGEQVQELYSRYCEGKE